MKGSKIVTASMIHYKGAKFDSFFVYDEIERKRIPTVNDWVDLNRITGFAASVCPWCIKKYGLYEETYTSPEYVDKIIELADSNNICKCDTVGCNNGSTILMHSKTFSIEDENGNVYEVKEKLDPDRIMQILQTYIENDLAATESKYVLDTLRNACGCTDKEIESIGLGYLLDMK